MARGRWRRDRVGSEDMREGIFLSGTKRKKRKRNKKKIYVKNLCKKLQIEIDICENVFKFR
jgi:hypothetical protein